MPAVSFSGQSCGVDEPRFCRPSNWSACQLPICEVERPPLPHLRATCVLWSCEVCQAFGLPRLEHVRPGRPFVAPMATIWCASHRLRARRSTFHAAGAARRTPPAPSAPPPRSQNSFRCPPLLFSLHKSRASDLPVGNAARPCVSAWQAVRGCLSRKRAARRATRAPPLKNVHRSRLLARRSRQAGRSARSM